MKRVELTHEELEYLRSEPMFEADRAGLSQRVEPDPDGIHVLHISEEVADRIRDSCGELLQQRGFDGHYSPTHEGRLLEVLIDKFLVS